MVLLIENQWSYVNLYIVPASISFTIDDVSPYMVGFIIFFTPSPFIFIVAESVLVKLNWEKYNILWYDVCIEKSEMLKYS
jgi:hypothetical protein